MTTTLRSELIRRCQLFRSLVVEAHPLWVFIFCVLVAYLCAELGRKLFQAEWYFVLGKALELFGLFFVVLEIISVRKLVGLPGFVKSALGWFKKSLGLLFKPKPIIVHMSGFASGITLNARGRLTSGSASNKLADRVKVLENNLVSVHKELDRVYGLIDAFEKNTTTKIDEKARILIERLEKLKALVAEIASGDSATKLVGVFLVLLGFIVQNFPRDWSPSPLF
jgi:hypothetical protein